MCTSIRTRLRFFRSIFCSRRPLPQPSLPSQPNLRSFFPMSTQSPPLTRKSTTGPSQGVHLFFSLSLQTDRWRALGRLYPPSRWLKFHPLRLPSFWDTIGHVCTRNHIFFRTTFCRIISCELYFGLCSTLLDPIVLLSIQPFLDSPG